MGKAKHFRSIRKVAMGLPALSISRTYGVRILGAHLLKQGIEKLADGTKVKEHKSYSQKKKGTVPVNHYRQMKKAYYKHGMIGAKNYALAVEQHSATLNK